MTSLAQAISLTGNTIVLIIFIRAILSLFPAVDPYHPVVRFLDTICAPIFGVFRRLMPPVGMLDLSPLLAILTVQLVTEILVHLLMGIGR
ncbi:MAG: YggT family protein [Candidatus Sericytochromatia bacterium]|nr:YggT family protein [Candidatus Sericytochromatia bacterium]